MIATETARYEIVIIQKLTPIYRSQYGLQNNKEDSYRILSSKHIHVYKCNSNIRTPFKNKKFNLNQTPYRLYCQH